MGGTITRRPMHPIFNTNLRMDNRSLCAKFQVRSRLPQTDGPTDRHSLNVLEFRADQISPRNLGSQTNISRYFTRIDKTNIQSMSRV